MKTASIWIPSVLALLLAVPAFAQRGPGAGKGSTVPNPGVTIAAQTLSIDEETSLLRMREEEKLARDVYLTLYAKWQLLIFDNIATSEQRHFEAIGTLLERYGLPDPALEAVGAFSNSEFAAFFDSLINLGAASVTEALKVGAAIEEMDIADLNAALAAADNSDVVRVYTNLLKGSENHLRAFVSHLEVMGESYVPKYLDAAAAADILTRPAVARSGYGAGTGTGTCPRP